jgi:hypothetical protein
MLWGLVTPATPRWRLIGSEKSERPKFGVVGRASPGLKKSNLASSQAAEYSSFRMAGSVALPSGRMSPR